MEKNVTVEGYSEEEGRSFSFFISRRDFIKICARGFLGELVFVFALRECTAVKFVFSKRRGCKCTGTIHRRCKIEVPKIGCSLLFMFSRKSGTLSVQL